MYPFYLFDAANEKMNICLIGMHCTVKLYIFEHVSNITTVYLFDVRTIKTLMMYYTKYFACKIHIYI